MKVQTVKGTNLAQQLIPDKLNAVITQIDTDISPSGKGSTLSINGEVTVLAQHYELELHDAPTEVRIIDEGRGVDNPEYLCLKGMDVKVEDFVFDKYTYDGSAWGIA